MPNEEDKIKTGWKLSDHKGPRVAKCMESKGRGGRVSINNSWQWHNGKEREKDGDVMMVDAIYTVCRTWTLGPLAHLGEKKKEKRRRITSKCRDACRPPGEI